MKRKSIYNYSAEAGIPIGIYLSVMSACLLMSVKVQMLSLFILPLAIGFPFILWFILKNICKAEPSYKKFSTVWLGGIYSVIFGTLICLLLSSLYMINFEPGFVTQYFLQTIEVVENSDMAGQYEPTIRLLREAMDAHILPSGMEFLMTMGWFTCFAGSILSLFLSLIITRSGNKVSSQASI